MNDGTIKFETKIAEFAAQIAIFEEQITAFNDRITEICENTAYRKLTEQLHEAGL